MTKRQEWGGGAQRSVLCRERSAVFGRGRIWRGNKWGSRREIRAQDEETDRDGVQGNRPASRGDAGVATKQGPARDISHKRAEAVAILVREYGYGVSEVAKYLGRDGGAV